MKNKRIYIVAFFLFAAAVGWLCYSGFTENSVYFLNVAEARSVKPEDLRQARLFGVVAESNLTKDLTGVEFNLLDKDNEALLIPIVYKGAVPDTFKPGAEVIVEGSMGDGDHFIAKTLMTKCPSKYQKENRSI